MRQDIDTNFRNLATYKNKLHLTAIKATLGNMKLFHLINLHDRNVKIMPSSKHLPPLKSNKLHVDLVKKSLQSLVTSCHFICHKSSYSLRKNTIISPNFLVWKFCRKAQEIRWNYGDFMQWSVLINLPI